MEQLKNEQHRTSTKRSYRSVWKNFNQFFIQLDIKPTSWEDGMALYVGYLVKSQKQSSTVRSYISAIKAILTMNNIKLNPDQYLLTSLTRACKVVNDQVRTRLPLRKHVLTRILLQIQRHFCEQPFLSAMYSALFSTAYFGLFRVGELTRSPHVVRATDVKIATNKNKIMFVLSEELNCRCVCLSFFSKYFC